MKMTFRLVHGKIDFLCAVNELVTETLLSLCMLWLQLHWKSFRILLEPHLYRLLRGHKICTAVQFTTELEAHAICQLGRQEHQAGQRFPWQEERHWKEYFKKIVITVSLLLLSRPQPSHCLIQCDRCILVRHNSLPRFARWLLAYYELIRPLTGLVYHPAGCQGTLLTS